MEPPATRGRPDRWGVPERLRRGRGAGDLLLGGGAALRLAGPRAEGGGGAAAPHRGGPRRRGAAGALPEQAEEWERTVSEMAEADDEVREYVRQLEEQAEADADARPCPRRAATRSPWTSSATCAAGGRAGLTAAAGTEETGPTDLAWPVRAPFSGCGQRTRGAALQARPRAARRPRRARGAARPRRRRRPPGPAPPTRRPRSARRACRGRRRAACAAARRGPAVRAGVARDGLAPARQPLLRGLEQVRRPRAVAAVVAGEQGQPDRHRVDARRAQLGDEHQVAAALATSSRRPGRSCRRARSAGRRAARR